jgi:uncharacterized membrane protein
VDTRLRISGHSIQPVLVTFPVGLFVCAALFDLARLVGAVPIMGEVGYWTVVAGLVAAALTLVAGLVELWDVPEQSPLRRPVVTLLLVNGAMAGMFLLGCLMRAALPDRGASGSLVALEAAALAVGGLGVRLGARLMRRVEPIVAEPATEGLGLVFDDVPAEVPLVTR